MNNSDNDSGVASLSVSGDDQIQVRGVLNFETVPVLMKQAEKLFEKLSSANISFNGVEDSNSAGLALLLEMARYMKIKNKPINFQDLPEPMRVVARAYGIESELDAHLESKDFLSV